MLTGYFDESGNSTIFSSGCLIGGGNVWQDFEKAWVECLNEKNKSLRSQGRKEISRYKAADCSSTLNEFAGWAIPEQIEFTKQLLAMFENRELVLVSHAVNLTELITLCLSDSASVIRTR